MKPSGFVPEDYQLVWNDEFSTGPMPDTSKWGYQTGGFGWTAKELQNYLEADPDNVGVEKGVLRITALMEKAGKNGFSSTRLVTKRKASFEEGYFEVKAKFPTGEGLRSSFWMVGDTVSKIGWPNAGEIDLVEHYGKFPTVANAAVQTTRGTWQKNQPGGSKIIQTAETEFHVYSCHWTSEKIEFAADGEVYWTYDKPAQFPDSGYPFKWPFYMVATLSVGGQRGPIGTLAPEVFPANFYLDYVRVYQLPKE